ncbi:MAG: hypothetical protein ACM3L6_04700 [Deltaproteobacteria bacterium]
MFKRCSCGARWSRRPDFLGDTGVKLLGYQANFEELELGLFLFNHETCGTTLALEVRDFGGLYDGPVFEERKTGTAECPSYCLRQDNLDACPSHCACAYVRQIIQIVRTYPGK